MTPVEQARTEMRAAVTRLASAHRAKSLNNTIPAREDDLFAARMKYWIAKVAEDTRRAKRPLPQAHLDSICEFLVTATGGER